MPASKRGKPLYTRGDYRLQRRADRSALEIIWYDRTRKRERSASAGTEDIEEGRTALDRLFLEHTGGQTFCPTCGQRQQTAGVFVTAAIADYLILVADRASIEAIRARLTHVLNYLVKTDQEMLICESVDEDWVAKFRKWMANVTIMSPTGKIRKRSLSTIENSVLQLAAAINKCGVIVARFKAHQPKAVNRTPQHRSGVEQLAAMFRFCVAPEVGKQPIERAQRDRANLLAFLQISVATLARPDAAHDLSTAIARKQWNPTRRIIALNPEGRRQTRKYRAVIPAPRQIVPLLDAANGYFVGVQSVKSAWESMAARLGLPRDGESGFKLIRRSMADVLRSRLPQEAWGEVEIWLGHDRFNDVSDLYAPFRPDYLRRALAVVEEVIDEIEALTPGAFVGRRTAAVQECVNGASNVTMERH
jgi:hypothetical protein